MVWRRTSQTCFTYLTDHFQSLRTITSSVWNPTASSQLTRVGAFLSGTSLGWWGLTRSNTDPPSNLLIYSAAKILPSTVQLRVEVSGKQLTNLALLPFNPNGENHSAQSSTILTSNGTGFIIDEQGTILTAAHVIADMVEGGHLRLIFHDGTSYFGEVLGLDLKSDLALVRARNTVWSDLNNESLSKKYPPVNFYDHGTNSKLLNKTKECLQPGEIVATIGSPFGLRGSITTGILSATEQSGDQLKAIFTKAFSSPSSSTNDLDSRLRYYQTDLSTLPGNSGGPLFRVTDGQVIGMIDGRISCCPDKLPGITLAIKVDTVAHSLIRELSQQGRIFRPYLGIQGISLTSELLLQVGDEQRRKLLGGLEGNSGVLVTKVHDRSPGSEAGLRPGDVISHANGQVVQCLGDVLNRIIPYQERPLHLRIRRILDKNDGSEDCKSVQFETNIRVEEFDYISRHH